MFFIFRFTEWLWYFQASLHIQSRWKQWWREGGMRDVSANDTTSLLSAKAKIFIESTADTCFLLCVGTVLCDQTRVGKWDLTAAGNNSCTSPRHKLRFLVKWGNNWAGLPVVFLCIYFVLHYSFKSLSTPFPCFMNWTW